MFEMFVQKKINLDQNEKTLKGQKGPTKVLKQASENEVNLGLSMT